MNGAHYFIIKTSTKRQLQQIALNHWPNTEFKKFQEALKRY